MNPGDTFSLTQVRLRANRLLKSNLKSSESESKLFKLVSIPKADLTSSVKNLGTRRTSQPTFRSISTANSQRQRSSVSTAREKLSTIKSQVQIKLDDLYSQPSQLIDAIKKLEKSGNIKDQFRSLEKILNIKKQNYNTLRYERRNKDSYLRYLIQKDHQIIKLDEIKEINFDEKINELENNIYEIKEKIYQENLYSGILLHMNSTRQRSLCSLSRPISDLRKEISQISIQIKDYLRETAKSNQSFKDTEKQMDDLNEKTEKIKEKKEEMKKEDLARFEERVMANEFIQKQKEQRQILNKISENEKEVEELENALAMVDDIEEINKEIQACKTYIKRQEAIFSQLKRETNVRSLDSVVSNFNYLKETEKVLRNTQLHLEHVIGNASKEVENLQEIYNGISLINSTDEDVPASKIEQIENSLMEKNQHLQWLQEKEYKQKKEIAELSSIVARLMFQVQDSTDFKEVDSHNIAQVLASFEEKIVNLKSKSK
ncbi:unnamed protein product [Blepharisma stoltei]|uniref:Uncharacterized protein n=1 Tax=Blepharisma stoltei TaxID=1481888 RepID=A0AAU9J125_9CILI|nr:unnamed protein product [Blepharisma stoltei]